MPRRARIDAPGALHHIINRGIERLGFSKILLIAKKFLKRLGLIFPETRIRVMPGC